MLEWRASNGVPGRIDGDNSDPNTFDPNSFNLAISVMSLIDSKFKFELEVDIKAGIEGIS